MTSERPGSHRHVHRSRDKTILAGQRMLLRDTLLRAGSRAWRLAHERAKPLQDARLENEAKNMIAEYSRASKEAMRYIDAICSEGRIDDIRAEDKETSIADMIETLKVVRSEFCFELEERACEGLIKRLIKECPEKMDFEWVWTNPGNAIAALDAMRSVLVFVRHVYEQEEEYYKLCNMIEGDEGSYSSLLTQIFSARDEICAMEKACGGKVSISFSFAKKAPEEWGVEELVSAFTREALGKKSEDAEGRIAFITPPDPYDMMGRREEVEAAMEVAGRVLGTLRRVVEVCREWTQEPKVVTVDFPGRKKLS